MFTRTKNTCGPNAAEFPYGTPPDECMAFSAEFGCYSKQNTSAFCDNASGPVACREQVSKELEEVEKRRARAWTLGGNW